ncbi:uncharacterized protein LOC117174320 [Belonocnema kinseyi]|uniref:uncharacterized protein LOC117174320 n=1 Tax=Belonocnema kinseyi TaxID=2817044 RepID=UPI00143D8E93|nr:uncharacterized protein LOC117174320 [Belonocnema kinseyi]
MFAATLPWQKPRGRQSQFCIRISAKFSGTAIVGQHSPLHTRDLKSFSNTSKSELYSYSNSRLGPNISLPRRKKKRSNAFPENFFPRTKVKVYLFPTNEDKLFLRTSSSGIRGVFKK